MEEGELDRATGQGGGVMDIRVATMEDSLDNYPTYNTV